MNSPVALLSTRELTDFLSKVSVVVMFHTTDSTLSLSPLEMLRGHIVDHHHYQSYTPFAHPDNSHTGPGPPALYYMQKHLYPIFGTSHVNGFHSTHVYLLSISEYGHTQSKYHMFSFPCHMFVLFLHMLLIIIPHAISKVFHMLVALHYPLCFIPSVYKLRVPVLYFLSFKY